MERDSAAVTTFLEPWKPQHLQDTTVASNGESYFKKSLTDPHREFINTSV
jgi:hypothetical protein